MSKEAIGHIDNRILFKETFNSEYDTRRLGGIPTNIIYSNGTSTFNGSSSYCNYSNFTYKGTVTIRVKLNVIKDTGARYLFDFRGSGETGTGYAYLLSNTISKSSGTVYINGIASLDTSNIFNKDSEIVISGMTINAVGAAIGRRASVASNLFYGDQDLIEIYEGTLTASEIKNLYNDRTYHALPNRIDANTYKILDVHSLNGVLKDELGNTLTETDISIKKIGQVYSTEFNGSTSKVDCGDIDDLVGDITIMTWVNPKTLGEANQGRLVDNTKLVLSLLDNNRIFISRNGAASPSTSTNVFNLNEWLFVAAISLSDGTSAIYIATKNAAPTLIASSLVSGTPVAGSNINIGNRNTSDRTQDGKISRTQIYKGVLSLEQLTQEWSNSRRYFNG